MLTNDEINFFKKLQNELNTQDHFSQADPRFWVIMDYKDEVTSEGYEDGYCIYNENNGKSYNKNDFLDYIVCELGDDYGYQETIDSLIEDMDVVIMRYHLEPSISDLKDLIEMLNNEVHTNFRIILTKRESFIRPDTMFLTLKDAQKHLELNAYHYSKDAHVYSMTAWRSPTVEKLISILQKADFNK